jgi:non-ribosomal peptide synthetase component F
MVLLGAFQLTLAAYADCDEVVCGTEVANRPWRSLAPAIGCFVNQLVIRTRCPRHDTVRTYLRRLRQTVLDAYAHQEAPFETVAAAIGGERSSARSPLFATKFVLKELAGVAPVEDVVPEPLDIDPLPPKWELLVDLWHRDHAIAGRVEFDRTIAAGIAEAFWCHLAKVVEMVASPQTADWTCARTHEAAEAAADREREAIASEPLHSYGAADAAHTI